MYIKMIDSKKLFGALQVGDVFISDTVPYIKIKEVVDQQPAEGGGVILIEINALNLATYDLEYFNDHTEVAYKESALVIGAGKGEV